LHYFEVTTSIKEPFDGRLLDFGGILILVVRRDRTMKRDRLAGILPDRLKYLGETSIAEIIGTTGTNPGDQEHELVGSNVQ
jgi:hypothetical protein